MKSYHHLSHQERAVLMIDLESGRSLRQLSTILQRSASTLSRELKRNSMTVDSYNANAASCAYHRRRLNSVKPQKLATNRPLIDIVHGHLINDKWSPEQISARLKIEENEALQVSHETIYSHIYAYPKGKLRKLLIDSLRRSKLKRVQRLPPSRYSSLKIHPEQLISQRPDEVNSRKVAGHWEGDLVVGKMNQY